MEHAEGSPQPVRFVQSKLREWVGLETNHVGESTFARLVEYGTFPDRS